MTPAETDLLRTYAQSLGLALEADAIARLGRFLDLLGVWNRRIHLTGERDRSDLIAKHVADSLAPCPYVPASGLVIDVGSGAGFPGIILACVRPDTPIVLLEPRQRRASFLNEAIRMIPLPHVQVVAARAEDTAADLRSAAELVISRALRLDTFLGLAAPLLGPRGRVLAMQAPGPRERVEEIGRRAGYRLDEVRSYSLPGGIPRSLLLFSRTG